MNSDTTSHDLLYLLQAKGKLNDFDVDNSDIISSVVFNADGTMLAIGDRGGRVVVLSRNRNPHKYMSDEYIVYSTFQSHEPDFDYLKSVEIEEKINDMSWLMQCQHANFLLTTNDKTIKLFKVHESILRKEKPYRLRGMSRGNSPYGSLDESCPNGAVKYHREMSIPHPVYDAKCCRTFANAHHYSINSVSACCNQEYFISVDDLRINLWSVQRNDTCFTIVDIKPENMESLTEIITSSTYHPSEPDVFLYSTSKGAAKLCDARINAICDKPTSIYFHRDSRLYQSRFSEAVVAISSLDFAVDSRYFLTRNYMEVNVWDVRVGSVPAETFVVQEYLQSDKKLMDMYHQDYIFDKFSARFGNNDEHIVTGSYDDIFSITKRKSTRSRPSFYLADLECIKHRTNGRHVFEPKIITETAPNKSKRNMIIDPDNLRYDRKVSSLDCHPTEGLIAIGVQQNLIICNTVNSRTIHED